MLIQITDSHHVSHPVDTTLVTRAGVFSLSTNDLWAIAEPSNNETRARLVRCARNPEIEGLECVIDWSSPAEDRPATLCERIQCIVLDPLLIAKQIETAEKAKPQTRQIASSSPALHKKDRDWRDYPLGTKAHAFNGGAWLRTERGWTWNGHTQSPGGTFPTPGGDACGACVELPADEC